MTAFLALLALLLAPAACAGPDGAARRDAASSPATDDPPAAGGGGLAFTPVAGTDLDADTASSPAAAWIDVDGDAVDDLLVLNGYASLAEEPEPQRNRLYVVREKGLEEVTDHPLLREAAFSGSAVPGDYDNDGDEDLFVANQRGADNRLYRNDGGGAYTSVEEGPVVGDGGRSFAASWVDVDGDGWLDLHVMNGRDGRGGQVDFVYRNDGKGGFERIRDAAFVTDTLPSGGAAWADYDEDGDPDVFLPVYSGEPNRLYRNDGDWTFTEVAARAGLTPDPLPASPPSSVAHWVDHDGDGDLDLFVGNTRGTVDFLYENDGEGGFRRVEAGRVGLDATYVSDATWADLENDGDRDLVIAVWGGASEIYLNDGEGALRPVHAVGFGERVVFASSVSASDFDADGDLDLLLTQWPINDAGGAPNLLYRNEGAAGSWIEVELEGRESNRSAIGARIAVTAEMGGEVRRQIRVVRSRTSWRSTAGPTSHFGLGDAGRVQRIDVTWPSGRTDSLAGPLEVNRRIRITEGGQTGVP